MVGLRSVDTSVVVPAARRGCIDGIEPTASHCVDAVIGSIGTVFKSDNVQNTFLDDANQYSQARPGHRYHNSLFSWPSSIRVQAKVVNNLDKQVEEQSR